MHNVTPERAMTRQARQLIVSGMLLLLLGLVIFAIGGMLVIIPLSIAAWYDVLQGAGLVIGGLFILFGLIQIIRGLRYPRDNVFAAALADHLAAFLDYRYTFIRNIGGRRLGYVDAVLIGPNGALVVYFFPGQGAYFTKQNTWYEEKDQKLQTIRTNPTQEAAKDVTALREYLAEHGLGNVPVFAVIVMSYAQTAIRVQEPVIPVAYMSATQPALADNYLARERITPEQIKAIVTLLLSGVN